MLQFVQKEADILVATTIIESGLDIPNANTMFIDQADHYGLADLHQLRGRVGRQKNRAYAYLLLDSDRELSSVAAKRLKAIEEFTELGAGFKIAMRDLEIRGAGNILGTEQSGHIASIGYELYCQLLENAMRSMKNLPLKTPLEVSVDLPWPAFLPRDYVPGQRLAWKFIAAWPGCAIRIHWTNSGKSFGSATAPFPSRRIDVNGSQNFVYSPRAGRWHRSIGTRRTSC